MLFGRYPNDGTELEIFMSQEKHCIKVPITPKVSEECKLLVESILVDEIDRYDIKKIRDNEWFKKEWEPIDPNITTKEYFENLNIVRQSTQEFEYSGAESSLKEESEDNPFLDSPKPQDSIDSTQTNT